MRQRLRFGHPAFCVVLGLGIAAAPPVSAADPIPMSAADQVPGSAWGAPAGVDPCGSEAHLEAQLARDPELAARRELFEALLRQADEQGLAPKAGEPGYSTAAATYLIPVAVHIVHHPSTPLGIAEHITDEQVLSQIEAVNRDMQNLANNGAPATDTKIEFCLATQLPGGSSFSWSTTPGITRFGSTQTVTIFNNPASEAALKAIHYLPADRYLNIWVVKEITGGNGGVVGYANFPGSVPLALDGIVMDHRVFGSNTTPTGTTFGPFPTLLPSNDDGKVLAHEVGHWLNLYHTFHLACIPPGDKVLDTPYEALANSGCPTTAPVSCSLPDPIQNFMNYTNDSCRWAFTGGQTLRMHAAIGTYRSLLVSAGNLFSTGCSTGLNALINVSPGQVCVSDTVLCWTDASGSGYTYAWSFPGGSPASATTQIAKTTYSTPGPHIVTLTVVDGANNFSSNTKTVYAVQCAPITGACTNWVFSTGCQLDFSTGVPQAVAGTVNFGNEGAPSQISDSAGNLLFYTDGDQVWDATNAVMPNGTGLLGGASGHNASIICPRPGSSTQYFLFTTAQWEYGPVTFPLRVNTVDMTLNGGLGDVVAAQKNIAITLPGGPQRLMEAQTLIPQCNGVDWWHVTHGALSWGDSLYVTPITAGGPGTTAAYPVGMGNSTNNLWAFGVLTASQDGMKLAVCSAGAGAIKVYNFDRATGAPTLSLNTGNIGAYHDVSFSPNGKLVYYTYFDSGLNAYGLRQLELSSSQVRTLSFPGPERCMELGPDGKVYVSASFGSALGCVNFPDNFNTANLNECGYNPASVVMTGTATFWGGLPNTLPMCTSGPQPAQFTYTITNCLTVNFVSPNCPGPWTWTFGDQSGGSGQSVSHTYALPGTYTVQLTAPSGAPPTFSQQITVGPVPISIVGPGIPCGPANYSVNGPSNYTYTWTITGGSPASATGSNVDVNWGLGGGTIMVTATDPVTGCVSMALIGVEACLNCTKPPLGMVAWWPLDESSGATAQEVVAGNNGQDINAPQMAPALVKNGRLFNGFSNYVRVHDAPKLNLGTSNLSIDAWVQYPPGGSNYQGIVDKRSLGPDRGYALYGKNGYLALQLADGSSSTEYTSTSTPLINDGNWHHVAATVDRANATTGTRLYVDGSLVAMFPGYAPASNIDNTARLLIGAMQPWAAPVLYFNGKIDEVEIFNRELADVEVGKLYGAGSAGKCKEYCWTPAAHTFCIDQQFAVVTMQVCNYSATQQTYNLSFQGLPNGASTATGSCSWNGPTGFQVLSPSTPVVVPGESCVPVTLKINRPLGMPSGATACYSVTMTNMATNESRTTIGSITASSLACLSSVDPVFVSVALNQATGTAFELVNTSPVVLDVPLIVQVMPSEVDPLEPSNVVSLNGLPPGEPWFGWFQLAPGETTLVAVGAMFTEPMPFRFYDLILSADTDGDGQYEPMGAIGMRYVDVPEVTSIGDMPPPAQLAFLPVGPNPFERTTQIVYMLPRRGWVRVALYDVAGRRVRGLVDGARDAGRHALTLHAAELSSGIYFLRLEMEGQAVTRRLVLLR